MLLDSTPLPRLAPLYAQSFNSITWTEGFGLQARVGERYPLPAAPSQ